MMLNDLSLARKVILNTRDSERAGGVAEILTQHGAVVRSFPTLQFRSLLVAEAIAAAFALFSRPGILMFSSAMALRELERAGLTDAVASGGHRVFVVGPETKRVAERVGMVIDHSFNLSSELNSLGLVEQVLQFLRQLPDQLQQSMPIIYCGAEGREGSGLEKLRAHGFSVEELAVYRAEKPHYTPQELSDLQFSIENQEIDAALLFSAQGAENFVELLSRGRAEMARPALFELPVVAIGPKTAEKARVLGFSAVYSPTGPAVSAMVQTLISALAGAPYAR